MSIVLPLSEWEIISNKVDENEPLNPLERFIYENLPAGEDEQLFYIQLRNALEYVVESAIKSPNKQSTSASQIAEQMEKAIDRVRASSQCIEMEIVRGWVRQLRTL